MLSEAARVDLGDSRSLIGDVEDESLLFPPVLKRSRSRRSKSRARHFSMAGSQLFWREQWILDLDLAVIEVSSWRHRRRRHHSPHTQHHDNIATSTSNLASLTLLQLSVSN
jgi:hypothetical protein